MEEGADAGVLTPGDSALTATAMIAMLNEVCVWFREGGTHSLEQVADIYALMSVKMVNPAHVIAPG